MSNRHVIVFYFVYPRMHMSSVFGLFHATNVLFWYLKGPLIKMFQVDAPYDCIILTLHENDKKTSFQGFRKGMQCS